MADYKKLKSGTDIRGRAVASETEPALLTESAVGDFAAAFGYWLSERTGKKRLKLSVGHDSRVTGEAFTKAIINALRHSGFELFDCGLFSTPASYLTTQFPSMLCDGAIMITASHHPMHMNGLKFFTADGGVNAAELDEIISLAEQGKKPISNMLSTVLSRDYLRLYCDALTDVIRKGTGLFRPLQGTKIAVDAGNGAGGFFASRVLAPLGADISPSQFLEPDGTFPAHSPNPENAEAIASLRDRVVETGADIGIIFDADVDRCAVVASDGTEINRCALIALAAAIVLPDHPGATIVTDSVTTEGLRKFIESRGGVQRRFRRGYRNVIDEAKRLNDSDTSAPIAIESSGHAAFAEHYFLDDGAYFIAKILVVFSNLRRDGMSLTDLISDLETPLEEEDIRLTLTGEAWRTTAEKIISRLKGISERLFNISQDNYEGVRAYIKYADGYFIVRTSVHDPVLPIYIESNKAGGAVKIARFLYSFLYSFPGLDCTPLEEFIVANERVASEEGTEEQAIAPNSEGADTAEESADGIAETADEQDIAADTVAEPTEDAAESGDEVAFESEETEEPILKDGPDAGEAPDEADGEEE